MRRMLPVLIVVVAAGIAGGYWWYTHHTGASRVAARSASAMKHLQVSATSSLGAAIASQIAAQAPAIKGDETQAQMMQNPFVQQLRTSFNNYLAGTTTGLLPSAYATSTLRGLPCGIETFPQNYYRSKFFLLDAKNSAYGGLTADIVFVDRPDTIFWTWVVKQPNGSYALRGICKNGPAADQQANFTATVRRGLAKDTVPTL